MATSISTFSNFRPLARSTTHRPASQDQVTLSQPVPKIFVSGAVAGALPGPIGACCALLVQEIDPMDIDSWDRAEDYYERVRECSHDVEVISANTPYSEQQVDRVKNHLFFNTHQLDDGVARFDADPLIANAWSRLQLGNFGPRDLQLIEHELFEARYESLYRTDYRTAHEAANRSGRPSGLYE